MVLKNEIKVKKAKGFIIRGCGVSGCCPVVEFEGNNVFVKDDYGNRVCLSKAQWQYLLKKGVEK